MIDARTASPLTPERVRGLVEATKLSQRECAERLGVKRLTLLRWMGVGKPVVQIPYTAQLALVALTKECMRKRR